MDPINPTETLTEVLNLLNGGDGCSETLREFADLLDAGLDLPDVHHAVSNHLMSSSDYSKAERLALAENALQYASSSYLH